MTHEELLSAVRDIIVPRNPEQAWVVDNLLFLHISGSRLYGTHTDASDWDVRGVTVAPKSYWVGARTFEHVEAQMPECGLDIVIYDLRKWLQMAINVNPNVVETLYVQPDSGNALHVAEAWHWIRGRTLPLISRRAHAGYHGYATSQIKKMVVKQGNKTGRRDLVEQFGFDSKFAMHGFRLARQGLELLTTGTMTFPRPDASWLRQIRDGRIYAAHETERCIADWEAEAARLDAALETSVLPVKSDLAEHDRLLTDVYDRLVHGTAAEVG
jgi:hypothetical protein